MIEKVLNTSEEVDVESQSGDYLPDEEEYDKHAEMGSYYAEKAMKEMEANNSSEVINMEHPMDVFDRKTIEEYKRAGKVLPIDAPQLTAQEVIQLMKEQLSEEDLSNYLYTDDELKELAEQPDKFINNERIDLSGLNALLKPYLLELKDFQKLGDTPFRLNAFNGVYAPSKTGKTYFVLEQLNSLDTARYKSIWLDGDRNSELKAKFSNIQHMALSDPANAFKVLIKSRADFSNYIFIVDSFKDFSFGLDTDTNKGCQNVFEIYQQLLNLGATLVIVFHSTKSFDGKGGYSIKLKGNADTIESKMDFLYKLERDTKNNHVNLTVQCAREEGLKIGSTISYADKEFVKNKMRVALQSEPTISMRDLKKKEGLSSCSSVIDSLEGSFYKIVDIQPTGGGRPKKGIELI